MDPEVMYTGVSKSKYPRRTLSHSEAVAAAAAAVGTVRGGRSEVERQEVSVVRKVAVQKGNEWLYSVGFSERMRNLLRTGFKSDAVILLGPPETCKERIRVHKFILMVGSPVLPALFRQAQFKNTLILDNVDAESLKSYLRILYGDTESEIRNPASVLKLASQYKSTEAVLLCLSKLPATTDAPTVCQVYELAQESQSPILMNETNNYVIRNALRLLESGNFSFLPLQCMLEIVKSDNLQIESELAMFKYVMRWGRAEALRNHENPNNPEVLRKTVEQLLPWIRFPVMELTEFIEGVASESILNSYELSSVLITLSEFRKEKKREFVPMRRSLVEVNRSPFLCRERRYTRVRQEEEELFDRRAASAIIPICDVIFSSSSSESEI